MKQQFKNLKIGDIIAFNDNHFWALVYKIELVDYCDYWDGGEVILLNLKNMSPISVYFKETIDKWIKVGYAKILG